MSRYINKIDDIITIANRRNPTILDRSPSHFNTNFSTPSNQKGHNINDINIEKLIPEINKTNFSSKTFHPGMRNSWLLLNKWKKMRKVGWEGKGGRDGTPSSKGLYQNYDDMVSRHDSQARTLNFGSEAKLAREIEKAAMLCKTTKGKRRVNSDPRFYHLYEKLRVMKHKENSLIKKALAFGTISGFITYIGNEQAKNSGCFRYTKMDGGDELIKAKVEGNFCNGDLAIDMGRKVPEEEHPLFAVDKWNCDFHSFIGTTHQDEQEIEAIKDRGCNGLCDPLHYNFMASFTDGLYKQSDVVDSDECMFVCEKATFLRTLAEEVNDVMSNIVGEGVIGHLYKIIKILIKCVILMVVLYIIARLYKLKNWLLKSDHNKPLDDRFYHINTKK